MTEEERKLWYDFLKRLPLTVKRQQIIGVYIVDFYIAEKGIVIEIDGAQHRMAEHKEADEKRDKELFLMGIKVLRYENRDVNDNFNTVCEDILKNVGLTYKDVRMI